MAKKTKATSDYHDEVIASALSEIEYILGCREQWYKLGGHKHPEDAARAYDEDLYEANESKADRCVNLCEAAEDALSAWGDLSLRLLGWAFVFEKVFAQDRCSDEAGDGSKGGEAGVRERSQLGMLIARAAYRAGPASFVLIPMPTQWAKYLVDALDRVDAGEVDPIFEPRPRKSYKDGYTLPALRHRAITMSQYLHGRGMSLASARRHVAMFLGASEHDLRNWERALGKELGYKPEFKWDRIAGAVDSGLGMASAFERLGIDNDDENAIRDWNRFVERPRNLIDEEIDALGKEYRHQLQHQKNMASRRKRKLF
jgi:hypothetical protein